VCVCGWCAFPWPGWWWWRRRGGGGGGIGRSWAWTSAGWTPNATSQAHMGDDDDDGAARFAPRYVAVAGSVQDSAGGPAGCWWISPSSSIGRCNERREAAEVVEFWLPQAKSRPLFKYRYMYMHHDMSDAGSRDESVVVDGSTPKSSPTFSKLPRQEQSEARSIANASLRVSPHLTTGGKFGHGSGSGEEQQIGTLPRSPPRSPHGRVGIAAGLVHVHAHVSRGPWP
jgi:hypothetical protein